MTDETKIQPGAPCPICGRPSRTETRPFCSRRCADVDLHRWLSGGYRIIAPAEEEEDERPAPPPRGEDS